MKKLKYIKKFVFEHAEYQLEDDFGNKAKLRINYKDNSYLLEYGQVENKDFILESNRVAKVLLKRKSGVNRASSIKL